MTDTKGEEGSLRWSLGPLGNKELFLWPQYVQIYKTGDTVYIRGLGTVKKELPHKCHHSNTKEPTVSPNMLWAPW